MTEKRVYEENIERIREFYKSNYYKSLVNTRESFRIKGILDSLYDDPDKLDKTLLKKASEYEEKYNIPFSPDGICGWKLLYDVYGDIWLDKYKTLRSSGLGTLYWPSKDPNKRTINIQRSVQYGDRIDYTLYDIKQKLEGKKDGKIHLTEDSDTVRFLDKIKKEKEPFKHFIDTFGLNPFIFEKNGDYEVINLSYSSDNPIAVSPSDTDFTWSNRYGNARKKELLHTYLENLESLIENSKENKEV